MKNQKELEQHSEDQSSTSLNQDNKDQVGTSFSDIVRTYKLCDAT